MRLAIDNRNTEVAQSLLQLSQESLQTSLVAITFSAWLWVAGIMLFAQQHTVHAWLVFFVILVAVWASYLLRERHWPWAVVAFVAGLISATSLVTVTFPSAIAPYFYAGIVFLTATFANPAATLGTAILCVALTLVLVRQVSLPLSEALLPIFLTLMAAAAAWLSSQRLYTALGWALTMTKEARKNAEEAQKHRGELQRALKSLDEAYVRLERAHEAIMYAREAAEKAYRFKAEFVANVSHELRTPLNLIVGFSEMMATSPESYGGIPLPSQYRGDVVAIYRNARHLSDLINDVLDLSRIEAGRMPLVKEAADLGEVIHEAAQMVQGLVEARGLQLELDLPDNLPLIRFDRTRIRQVLLNLLTNAIRFTDAGGIRVHARVREEEAEIAVQDTGRGITPEAIAKAFETFVQLDTEHAREGSGLGLAVSKKFVELHGGRMWIESEPGLGTTVSFTLPIPRGERVITVSRLKPGSPIRDYREQPLVLVLHDDPRSLPLLRRYLDGYEFALAETMDQARALIHEATPDAVIIDANWADYDEATLSHLGLPSHVPFITCPLPSLHRLGVFLGARDYLAKPVTREDLARALARLPRPPHTVLIVDDDPNVVRLLGRMLKAINPSIRVLKAFGGQEGLQIARSQRPDVILLDLIMPEMNGYAFLKELTQDARTAETQVILVSIRGVEQEASPIAGRIYLGRETGFSITESLQILQAMLSVVTRAPARPLTGVATPPGAKPG